MESPPRGGAMLQVPSNNQQSAGKARHGATQPYHNPCCADGGAQRSQLSARHALLRERGRASLARGGMRTAGPGRAKHTATSAVTLKCRPKMP